MIVIYYPHLYIPDVGIFEEAESSSNFSKEKVSRSDDSVQARTNGGSSDFSERYAKRTRLII